MHFSGRLIFAASSSYLIALSAATIPLSAQSDQIYHTFERGNFGLVSDNKLKAYRFSTKNLHGRTRNAKTLKLWLLQKVFYDRRLRISIARVHEYFFVEKGD